MIDIHHVAQLARLALSEDEAQRLGAELGDILAYVEQLNEVDTADVDPMTQVVKGRAPTWREDETTPGLSHDEALANAPVHDGESFCVPQVVT